MKDISELIDSASQALNRGDFETALSLARDAIGEQPASADAFVVLGIAHANLGNAADADAALRYAAQLAPDSARAHYNLATHLYRTGRREEAATAVEAALRADPMHPASRDLRKLLESERVDPLHLESPLEAPPVQQAPNVGTDRSESWIAGLGAVWPLFGWVAVILLFAQDFMFRRLTADIAKKATGEQMFNPALGAEVLQVVPSWLLAMLVVTNVVVLAWLVADIAAKRRSWFWLAPTLLCCLVASWMTPLIYLTTSRLEGRRI